MDNETMDLEIKKLFEEMVDFDLRNIIISNSTEREKLSKIKIRPLRMREEIYYQVSQYIGNQIFHSNDTKDELMEKLPLWFEGLFRQAEVMSKRGQAVVLISKRGKVTINYKKTEDSRSQGFSVDEEEERFLHDKKKNYILKEGTPLPFLVDLGVMAKDGRIIKSKSDKYRQINRFLEYIEDVLPFLDSSKELTVIDFGCGKSYLTFAMYYYLKELKGYQINVIGLDLKADVIQKCNALSQNYGYERLQFMQGDIASYHGCSQVDMVVTLHACNTATDHALYKAVSWGAGVILSVPCCQHELNGQIHNDILKPVLGYGIIKERMSALITDALRAELLEAKGYRVQLLEFIDMEHTPKNILIRAVRKNGNRTGTEEESRKKDSYAALVDFLGVSPCLQRLFEEKP